MAYRVPPSPKGLKRDHQVYSEAAKRAKPREGRIMGDLARTILRTLEFVEKHPEDANSPKYISEARGFCKENGFKLEKVKKVGIDTVPAWRMAPIAKPKETEEFVNLDTNGTPTPAA